MVFTRRFFVEAATAFSAWAGTGGGPPDDDRRLERLRRAPKKPVLNPACSDIYSVGITIAGHAVAEGAAVWQDCQGQMKVIGMALTASKQGEPVMVMLGYVPAEARVDHSSM
jgi:hypothetical protein